MDQPSGTRTNTSLWSCEIRVKISLFDAFELSSLTPWDQNENHPSLILSNQNENYALPTHPPDPLNETFTRHSPSDLIKMYIKWLIYTTLITYISWTEGLTFLKQSIYKTFPIRSHKNVYQVTYIYNFNYFFEMKFFMFSRIIKFCKKFLWGHLVCSNNGPNYMDLWKPFTGKQLSHFQLT